jgi:hypothetical protein
MSFAPRDCNTSDIGTTTAMPAVNAIPPVVAAHAGVLSIIAPAVITGKAKGLARRTLAGDAPG